MELKEAIERLQDIKARLHFEAPLFTTGYRFYEQEAAIIAAVLNAVADGRLGLAQTWQLPPEADRPRGFRCIGEFLLGWEECVWDGTDWRDSIGMPFIEVATRFIPIPPEARHD